MRIVIALIAAALSLGGCAEDAADPDGERSCAAFLDFGGHRYGGHGELKRDPATTGRVEIGIDPGCGGGDASEVEVAELVDIPMTRAVLVRGTLYVRSDLPFPRTARAWFVAPSCRTPGVFRLRGDWLSVEGPHEPRFDGDLRPPYRLGVHVTEGPRTYRGATIQVRATEHTHPALGPPDVKRSLWGGGKLVARVRCEDDRFIAEALVSTPG